MTQLYALHEVPEPQAVEVHLSLAVSLLVGGLQAVSRLVGTAAPEPTQHVEPPALVVLTVVPDPVPVTAGNGVVDGADVDED